MSKNQPQDLAASVLQRLKNARGNVSGDFNALLTRFALERFLYRLSKSSQTDRFILKGAMLFSAWSKTPCRLTKDLDMLGRGDSSPEAMASCVTEICQIEVEPDGLEFDPSTIRVSEIREGQQYQGQRIHLTARLGNARIGIQIDIGFGDALTPSPEQIVYPTIIDLPAARVWAYAKETVIAEKLQAMITLGQQNSRMKDFYDLAFMSNAFEFDGATLVQAIQATFGRRGIAIPSDPPLAFTEEFASDPTKQSQWQGFLNRTALKESCEWSLGDAVKRIASFLAEPLVSINASPPFQKHWHPSGPWA